MAAGWERDGLILGHGGRWAGELAVQGAGQEMDGCCRNGGIWDVSSLSWFRRQRDAAVGGGRWCKGGRCCWPFSGETPVVTLRGFWLEWGAQALASCWSVVMPGH